MFKPSFNFYTAALVIVAGFFCLILGCSETEPKHSATNLDRLMSFGNQGEVFLTFPTHMATDGENSIFISDSQVNKVYEFSMEGEFLREIGREGRGPGEYISPQALQADGEWLYVSDVGNIRMVAFNLNNDSSKIVSNQLLWAEFDFFQDKIYGVDPKSSTPEIAELESEGLINVYDRKWNLLNSFGEYIELVDGKPTLSSAAELEVTKEGVVHVLFMFLPLYRAYSSEGELLLERDLSEFPHLQELFKEEDDENGRYALTGSSPFSAFDVSGNRVFIARNIRALTIDEYQMTGDSLGYQSTYVYKGLPDDYWIADFFYHREKNAFSILEYDQVPKITIYQLQ